MKHESDGDTNCNCCARYSRLGIVKRTRRFGYTMTRGDHPNYCIVEIGQNTKKSPGDSKGVDVIQTPLKAISQRWCEKLLNE